MSHTSTLILIVFGFLSVALACHDEVDLRGGGGEYGDGTVDISGLDKPELLRALWNHQKLAPFFAGSPESAPKFDEDEARVAVPQGFIDYFCGRAIKADLSGNRARATMYDAIAGRGAMTSVVTDMRSGTHTAGERVHELLCPDGSGKFVPYGEPLYEGDEGSILCGNCPYLKRQHEFK